MASHYNPPSFSEQETEIPKALTEYINNKTQKSKAGGRPNFLQILAKDRDPKQELLDILEYAWIKNRSIRSIGRKYKTSYLTIYRILQDLEPLKKALIVYLETVPRRKVFYNRDSDSSDYETVQAFIRHARRKHLKHYKELIHLARKVWQFLKYKDPARWNIDEIYQFLDQFQRGSWRNRYIDAIRQVSPQCKDKRSPSYLETERGDIPLRKKDVFGDEVLMILKALQKGGLSFHTLIFKLHITLGAREGSTDAKSGMCGLSWDRFHRSFTVVDDYECKVRDGIWWRDCPVDLFFSDLSMQLRALWIRRDKPTNQKLILGGYIELLVIYKEIREALRDYYKGKVDPDLYKEFTTLRPHDSDKIHCNLLWESKVPIEMVAGKYLGKGEGKGLMGRGWLDVKTIIKHYLSLDDRSERVQRVKTKVQDYSRRFNGEPTKTALVYAVPS